MTEQTETSTERAIRTFREEMRSKPGEDIDLRVEERRIQELVNALGREMTIDVMKRADTDASEVEINGERWVNRRVLPEWRSVPGSF